MKVEYSNRAAADLRKLSADSLAFGRVVAAAVEARIRGIVTHIAAHPEAAQRVVERPGVHVVSLIRYQDESCKKRMMKYGSTKAHHGVWDV